MPPAAVQHQRGLEFTKPSEVRDVNWFTVPVMSLDGRFVAGPDLDGRSRLWSVERNEELYVAPDGWDIRAVGNAVEDVLVFRDSHDDVPSQAQIVDVRSGGSVAIDADPGVTRGYFTQDDQHLLLKTADQPATIWEASTGSPVRKLGSGDSAYDGFFDIGLGEDATLAATNEGTFAVFGLSELLGGFALSDSTRLADVDSNATFIDPIVLSLDASLVGTVGRDEPVRVWDGVTGDPVAVFPVKTPDASAAFHPTEPWVYIADGNTVTVHTLDVDELVELAYNDVTRELTEAECRQFLRRACGG